jgi:hypothetical protein
LKNELFHWIFTAVEVNLRRFYFLGTFFQKRFGHSVVYSHSVHKVKFLTPNLKPCRTQGCQFKLFVGKKFWIRRKSFELLAQSKKLLQYKHGYLQTGNGFKENGKFSLGTG